MPSALAQPALGRNSSVLLDIIRFAAAVAVLFSHLIAYSTKFRHVPAPLGNEAVGVFFVLSGFVIRFVTETRVSTLSAYLIDRASRIYSIVLPALLFTFIVEACARRFFPGGYASFAEPDAWVHALPRLLTAATFTDGIWGLGPTPFSNGALWSLTFEVVYYVLYGILRYTRVARWFLVPLILLLVGPSIAGLFPIWLLGALLFDLYAALRDRTYAVPVSTAAFLAVAALFTALRHPIVHLLALTDNAARIAWVTRNTASIAFVRHMYPEGGINWLARFSPSYFFLAIALTAALLPLMLFLDRAVPVVSLRVERAIRLVADSTFTLYCFHLPLLILLFSIVGHMATTWPGTLAAIVAPILFGIAAAIPLDRLKSLIRRALLIRFKLRAHS